MSKQEKCTDADLLTHVNTSERTEEDKNPSVSSTRGRTVEEGGFSRARSDTADQLHLACVRETC